MKPLVPHSRPWLLPEDEIAVTRAVRAGEVATFRHAQLLAAALAEYAGEKRCRLFGTGSLALAAGLRGLALPAGSGVAIPAFTCPDVLRGVLAAGLLPVVLDCTKSGCMDAALVRVAAADGRVRAAVAVHQFGVVNRDLESLSGTLPVLEDCCHVPPRRYLRDSVGAFGSFEGTKLLGAGEGGWLMADAWGDEHPGERLSDLVAAIACNQLVRLGDNLARRETLARSFGPAVGQDRVVSGERACWFRFLVRVDGESDVARAINAAAQRGILCRRPIMPGPLHRHPLAAAPASPCPRAEALWSQLISVPLYPALTVTDVERVILFLNDFFQKNAGVA